MTLYGIHPIDLPADQCRELLHQMLRIRRFEETCAQCYGDQKIRGFLHLYIGQEAVATGIVQALDADDAIVATYREHGHALVRGIPAGKIMAEMFGKATGCSRGRGGSMHLFDAATRFYGGNAIVGGGLPLAVGLALADRLQKRPRVTACFFGEGAAAEGAFHESLNLAALWRLPVLFCCENNRYAMGTALERAHAHTDLSARAAGYGMAAQAVDGMDIVAVLLAARAAVAAIRADGLPRFLELRTYRFRAHSMFDPELYRDKTEVAHWRKFGPVHTFTDRLKAQGILDEQEFQAMDQRVSAEVAAAVEFAEQSPLEKVSDLGRDLYTANVVA